MITYKIAGLDSVLKSKPENFEGDVLRWKQRSSLPYHAEVTILENDEHNNQPATDSAIDSDLGQLETLSEDTAAPISLLTVILLSLSNGFIADELDKRHQKMF